MLLAPYCARAGVAARKRIADQTNIHVARVRMIRLAPGGLRQGAHWAGALGSLLERPGQNTMRHCACSTGKLRERGCVTRAKLRPASLCKSINLALRFQFFGF